MATFKTADGYDLYYEEVGDGHPVVFIHEFAGDLRSYEPQIRYFSRQYRCITYNARGYPPSAVPVDPSSYSQDHARDDFLNLVDALNLDAVHAVGLSMGAFAALHVSLTAPERLTSMVVAGAGYGAEPDKREQFTAELEAAAQRFLDLGSDVAGRRYGSGPTRLQYERKDPRGYAEFAEQLAGHSALGSANTLLGVQRKRPSLWDLQDRLATVQTPALIITGDEDDPCIEPSIFLKRTIPSAGLAVVPNSGHTINLEEPQAFNTLIMDFFHQVESGRWPVRDPRTHAGGIIDLGPEPE